MQFIDYTLTFPLGFLIGLLGSLTGIGGGFLLMPLLLFLFPLESPSSLSAISMTVVFFNSVSGLIRPLRKKQIQYKTGLVYSLLALPGVLIGFLFQSSLSHQKFSFYFGIFLIFSSLLLFFTQDKLQKDSTTSVLQFRAGGLVAILIGFLSSFFGIGGGFLFVPLFIYLLNYQVRTATATSQFILFFTSITFLSLNIFHGFYHVDLLLMVLLIVSVIIGAQLGSYLADKLPGKIILRILAILLVLISIKFIFFQ